MNWVNKAYQISVGNQTITLLVTLSTLLCFKKCTENSEENKALQRLRTLLHFSTQLPIINWFLYENKSSRLIMGKNMYFRTNYLQVIDSLKILVRIYVLKSVKSVLNVPLKIQLAIYLAFSSIHLIHLIVSD
jgi:hypothetical protein